MGLWHREGAQLCWSLQDHADNSPGAAAPAQASNSGLLKAQAEAIDWGGEGETGGKVSKKPEYEYRSVWWHIRADIPSASSS